LLELIIKRRQAHENDYEYSTPYFGFGASRV